MHQPTRHSVITGSSADLSSINPDTVDVVVTSPPYPMIEMWDEIFFKADPEIRDSFLSKNYRSAFNLMHNELNKTWAECVRVLKNGGLLCVNIGDAARSLDGNFQLWPNHSTIQDYCFRELGLSPLPPVIWRKTTNKPNKFMGSGMLPPNAYVTLEHEYILIFRKGGIRKSDDTALRHKSAYFWEERNTWFSDLWSDLRGTKQEFKNSGATRARSAAFPLQLAYRLIAMFSLQGDTVLDPFWGTGTTSKAAMLLGRNSIGCELDPEFIAGFKTGIGDITALSKEINTARLDAHGSYIREHTRNYTNDTLQCGVVTKQEQQIDMPEITGVTADNDILTVTYQVS